MSRTHRTQVLPHKMKNGIVFAYFRKRNGRDKHKSFYSYDAVTEFKNYVLNLPVDATLNKGCTRGRFDWGKSTSILLERRKRAARHYAKQMLRIHSF